MDQTAKKSKNGPICKMSKIWTNLQIKSKNGLTCKIKNKIGKKRNFENNVK